MNLIERNSINELSIGNIDIDNDHMRLLELLQDLFNLTEFNSNREDFAKILSGLTDYALLHFKKEEMYMQEFSYPKLTEHKRSHQKYYLFRKLPCITTTCRGLILPAPMK